MSVLTTPTRPSPAPVRYAIEIPVVVVAAFTLSVAHTVYAWRSDLADPDFTVTSPLTWGFYAVAFAMAAVAARPERWAHVASTGFLVVVLGISVFYYPTTFTLEQQTTFGWFENDVYVGLLVLALYLSVMRLRRRAIVL